MQLHTYGGAINPSMRPSFIVSVLLSAVAMKRPPSGARDAMEVELGAQLKPDKETSPSVGEDDSKIDGHSGGQDLNSVTVERSPLLGKMSAVTSTVIFL